MTLFLSIFQPQTPTTLVHIEPYQTEPVDLSINGRNRKRKSNSPKRYPNMLGSTSTTHTSAGRSPTSCQGQTRCPNSEWEGGWQIIPIFAVAKHPDQRQSRQGYSTDRKFHVKIVHDTRKMFNPVVNVLEFRVSLQYCVKYTILSTQPPLTRRVKLFKVCKPSFKFVPS